MSRIFTPTVAPAAALGATTGKPRDWSGIEPEVNEDFELKDVKRGKGSIRRSSLAAETSVQPMGFAQVARTPDLPNASSIISVQWSPRQFAKLNASKHHFTPSTGLSDLWLSAFDEPE